MSYLVIQGLEVETPDLKEIAKLSGSTRIEGIGNNAFRLHDYKTQDGVAEYCAKAKLDFAFIPHRASSRISASWRWTWIRPLSPSNASTRSPTFAASSLRL